MKNPCRAVTAFTLGLVVTALFTHSAHAASLVLDQDFRTPLFTEAHPALRTLLLPDGKFVVFYNTDTLTDQRTGALTRYLPNGSLDSSFNFSRDYQFIAAAASVANGKMVVAATRYTYGNSTEQILRLAPDGSIDASFNTALVGSDPFSNVLAIVEQPDGKILVSGYFNTFAGQARQKIARLLADGTLDSTFSPPDFGGGFYAIHAKPVALTSGKILVAGDFRTVNGTTIPGVAQLNTDGSVDPSFQATGFLRLGLSTPIRGMAVQSDGKILLAGRFLVGSGGVGPQPAVMRLNANGGVDSSYTYAFVGGAVARDLVLQPDGKPIAAVSSSSANTVYRFSANGGLDSTFAQPVLLDNTYDPLGQAATPITLNLQADGRIILGGTFTDVNSPGTPDASHYGVVRLNSDGTVDPTLVTNHKTGRQDFPSSFARLPDGSALIAFGIPSVKNAPAMNFNLGRLLPNGSLDSSFTLSSSDPGGILSPEFIAQDFAQLADGKFFVFGWNGGGKFLPNGVQDLTFDSSTLALQKAVAAPDGRVFLFAGTDAQSTAYTAVARLRRNGTIDYGFGLPASVGSGQVIRDFGEIYQMYVGSHVLAVEPNGKVLFVYFSSDALFHFVRLNSDGSFDPGFSGATLAPINLTTSFPVIFDPFKGGTAQPEVLTATAPLQDAHILADGRILLCGQFTSYNGVSARGLVRLQSNGDIDPTFTIGGGPQWTQTVETASFFPSVESIEEQVDGKLLIAGTFEAFDGTALPGIASLNPDGSVDPSFTPPAKRQKFARGTTRLARQGDGSFLLSGSYSFPNETEPGFIHINSVGGVPVVGSPGITTAIIGQSFSYQITASGQPTSYSASGLPPGFTIDSETGLITGTPGSANIGVYSIMITATNDEGTSAIFYLTLSVIPSQTGAPPSLQNISTRLRVLTGDNALIGGFIITGFPPKRVIVRAIGPSLTNLGISGALDDTVLELHGPDAFFTTITNDNWRDTQQSEIEATGIPPGNNLESAIVATLPAGAYTAIVRGKNDGIGVGLVEAYDLDPAPTSQLANISTRGFVDTDSNVMIGGLIAGPMNAGSGSVIVRAIGPSLTGLGIPNALQNPTLELHDGNGAVIASNNDWRDTQGPAIEATGIAPSDDREAAILWVLSPGLYTAVVRGEETGVGVGLVEVYNLQ